MGDDFDSIVTRIGAETGNTAVNNIAMQRRNPMLVARAMRLADKFGVGSPLIEADPAPFEAQDKREAASAFTDDHPWTIPYFSQNPDVAAMLHIDDLGHLGNVSHALGVSRPTDPNLGHVSIATAGDKLFPGLTIPKTAPVPARRDYLPAATASGFHTAAGTLASLGDFALNMLGANETDADLAVLYKNDPQGLAEQQKSWTYALRRASAKEQDLSTEAMANVDPELSSKAYFTTDPSNAAYLSPTRVLGDALQSLPSMLSFAWEGKLAVGAATRATTAARVAGLGEKEALAAGAKAATRVAARFGVVSEAAQGGAQTYMQVKQQIEQRPQADWDASPQYQQLLKEGFTPEAAKLYITDVTARQAAGGAAISDAGTVLATSPLFGKIFAEGGHRARKAVLGFLEEALQEGPQSAGEQYTQNLAIQQNADPRQSLGQGVMENAVGGAVVGGLIGGGFSSLAGGHPREVTDVRNTVQDSMHALQGQQILDEIMKNANEAPLRKLSPESFAATVEAAAEHSPVKHVFIPVEAIDRVLADETIPEEEKAALTVYQSQIEEARVNNGDVVIPVGEAAAKFAGTKTWDAIREDTRVVSDGVSPKEGREQLKAAIQEMEKAGNDVVEQAKTIDPQLEAKRGVYEDVKAQMIKAGRSTTEAQTTAALVASRAETLASDRYGQFKDAGEAWKWMQLQIKGPEGKAARGGRKVAQAAQEAPVVNIGLDIPTGGQHTPEAALQALRDHGVEVLSHEVRQSASEPTVIARLNRALTPKEGHSLSVALQQEAIAQRTTKGGALYGPSAKKWGSFNPDYFLEPGRHIPEDRNGFPLEDVLASSVDNGKTDPTIYQQFGGRLGASNSAEIWSQLDLAKRLEAGVETEENIWHETGWQRGPDGLWRFEIDDSKAKLIGLPSAEKLDVFENTRGIDYDQNAPTMRSGAKTIVVGARLSQVLDHPQLYKLYPHLADMPVFAMDLEPKDGGYFDGRRIVYNDNEVDPAKIQSVLHHEIQHAIQLHEGFVNGASAAADGLRALGLGDELDATIKYYEAIRAGEVPGRVFRAGMSDSDIRASAAFHIYQRVAGENEARMVQEREQYTPEERKEWMPNFKLTEFGHPVLLPQNSNAFAQSTSGPQAPRGETSFYPNGKTIINLFKADASTMLHELSHVFLEQEFRLAQEKGASPELKADIEKLKKWFKDHGADFNGSEAEKTAAHELFARTGERYFREGKAPSAELRGAFKQFREWMTSIYKQVKNLLAYGPAPINPEIREIFDRIIATDDAIAANATQPMSQEELGMTSAEYEAYLGSVNNARDAAYDALLDKMMKAIRQREDKALRAQRANVREEVAQKVNSDPRFVALHLLRTNRWLNDPNREAPNPAIKINTGWLIDNYGEDILNQLPVGLQPIHRGDGVDGDTIAEMVGMPSGDALVKSLLDLKRQADQLKADGNPRPLRDQIIENQTNAIMAQRHGDIAMSEADIREEAIGALNSNRQGEVLATELRQLKKKSNRSGVVTPYQILREWARRKANEGTVADAVSKETLRRYTRLFNRARSAFEEAILKGDTDEAIKQKQAQLINHALLAEGKKVADDIDAVVRRMQRLARTKALASVDQDYMDRVHELLEGYNFRTVSDVARAEKASFEEWAAKEREKGNEVYVPARFRDDRVNWKDAQVSKLLELNDMVESLVALGKLKQKLIIAGEERRLDEMRDEAEASALQLPERNLGDASTSEITKPFRQRWSEAKTFGDYSKAVLTTFRPGSRVRQYASGLVKIEGVADLLDQTKMGTGVLNRVLIRGATDAANNYSTLKEEVMDGIAKAYHAMSGKMAARLNNLVTIPELSLNAGLHEIDPRRGKPLNITRRQLIALVANTGNLSNLSKLVGGERWGDPESMVDMTRVQQTLIGYLDKEEMDFVQSLWDGMQKLWPHIARVERELTGVVPETVTPMDVQTPWGTYSGGYWPVVWDADRTDMGKPDEEKSEANMFGVGSGLGTYKGHTITRTGAMAPMDWSLERVLFARTNQVISRIAYAQWIRDSLKLLNSSRVSGAIRLRLGNEYLGAIKSWMRDQIPSNMQDISGAKAWEKVLTAMRVNMTATVLGISYSTGIAQVQGLTYSAGVLGEGNVAAGPKWIAAGFQRMIQLQMPGQPGAQEFVFGRSEEMRRRAHELNYEVRTVFDRLGKSEGNRAQRAQRWLQAKAFWHIAFIDLNTVSIPTWLGGYEKAKAQGLSEADAAAYADKTVRLSQGSGREKDMSAIQRGGAGQRFISMFYTPSSVFFNAQWEAAQEMKAGNWSKALAPTFWFLVANTLMDAFRNGDWPPEDEDGNVTPEAATKWIARNLFFGMFYGVPVARDIANTANRKLRGQYADWGSTPLSYGLQAIGKGLTAGYKQITGGAKEEDFGRNLKNEATAVGFVLGLPGNQIGRTSGFIADVSRGKEHPETIGDWFTGLTSGSTPKSSGSKQ